MPSTMQDKRTRIGVFLYKADRGTTKFWCVKCKNYLAELNGNQVQALTDIISDEATGISIRCSGSIEPGQKCHTYYTFMLGTA